jgi:ornithine cyclodeaminase/alanine dehydrogenase-like protein (mu-crystallin family)
MTIINRRKTDRLEQLGNELRALFTNSKDSKVGVEVEVDIVLGVNGEEGFDQERVLDKADVIVTATPSTESLFPSSAIPSRDGSCSGGNDVQNNDKKRNKTAIILIGSYKPHMREIDADLVDRALQSGGKITCDSREACLTEAGELQHVRPDQIVELGEVLNAQDSRTESVRPEGGEVNIYKSVGIAVQDVAVANAMIEAAEGLGVGTIIEDYD